jgi:hypothetical protein
MAVVAGVVFFAVRALLALIPGLTVASRKKMVGGGRDGGADRRHGGPPRCDVPHAGGRCDDSAIDRP